MSNAVVTRYLADLERHLGTRLLNRTTRSLSLTEAGETYLHRCRQILEDVTEAEASVMSQGRSLSGLLRVATSVGFGQHLLPDLMTRFQALYPEVVFDVLISDAHIDLVDEGRDLAIMLSDQGIAKHLVARPLRSGEAVLCATPDYLKQHPAPRHARELTSHRCVALRQTGDDYSWTLLGPEGPVTVPIRPGIVCTNAELAHRGILAGMGVGMLSPYLARTSIEAGRLVRVLPQYQLPRRSLSIVYPSRTFLPAKVRKFVDFLLGQCQ
jgi:DNA-binding transcriptional LysR family regulator